MSYKHNDFVGRNLCVCDLAISCLTHTGFTLLLPFRVNDKKQILQILRFRFHIKVMAAWERGSNADVALDDVTIGAACFDTGDLCVTCHQHIRYICILLLQIGEQTQ